MNDIGSTKYRSRGVDNYAKFFPKISKNIENYNRKSNNFKIVSQKYAESSTLWRFLKKVIANLQIISRKITFSIIYLNLSIWYPFKLTLQFTWLLLNSSWFWQSYLFLFGSKIMIKVTLLRNFSVFLEIWHEFSNFQVLICWSSHRCRTPRKSTRRRTCHLPIKSIFFNVNWILVQEWHFVYSGYQNRAERSKMCEMEKENWKNNSRASWKLRLRNSYLTSSSVSGLRRT